ncbi:hypothetical protein SCAB_45711 [Streptomyces scabiei 87.22]|uniref:Uncharacterized protein n=1 Tax=Streptomyces scabiei (strain 87.22) TaxID=680198 RepID=C9ZAJ7_STRSW|nr:hypothetical protein SCAB_45711 [Streptomyces scabiei 87.22]
MNIDISLRADPGRARGRGFVSFGRFARVPSVLHECVADTGFALANDVLAEAKRGAG